MSVKMHSRFNVTCIVDADPPVTSAYFYWYLPKDPTHNNLSENKDLNVTLQPVAKTAAILQQHPEALWERKGSYYAITYRHGTDMVMVLQIDDMQMQMYRPHYFVAENEHGSIAHSLTFLQGDLPA